MYFQKLISLLFLIAIPGTVFSSKFLESDKKNAKKFATVYSQLIARSTIPPHCMDCECTASDNGISYMECYLCTMVNTSRSNVEMVRIDFHFQRK